MNTSNWSIIGNDFYNSFIGLQKDFHFFERGALFIKNNKNSCVVSYCEKTPMNEFIKWSYTFSKDGCTFNSWFEHLDGKFDWEEPKSYKVYEEVLNDTFNIFSTTHWMYANSDLWKLEIK